MIITFMVRTSIYSHGKVYTLAPFCLDLPTARRPLTGGMARCLCRCQVPLSCKTESRSVARGRFFDGFPICFEGGEADPLHVCPQCPGSAARTRALRCLSGAIDDYVDQVYDIVDIAGAPDLAATTPRWCRSRTPSESSDTSPKAIGSSA